MAEGILQQLANDANLDWTVHSAGTNFIHTGEPPHKNSQKVCAEKGIDISAQRSMDFAVEHFETYDKIYVMAADVLDLVKEISGPSFEDSKIDFFLNELYPETNQNVKDPWFGGPEGYYAVFDQINDCCQAIFERYKPT